MGYSHKERTIGGNPPEYMPDTYQHGRQLGKELRRQARSRIPKPFNSAPNCGSGLFNPNPFNNLPGPDKSAAKKTKFVPKKAFVPSNPSKKGAAYAAISKVGRDYVPEPIRAAEVCMLGPADVNLHQHADTRVSFRRLAGHTLKQAMTHSSCAVQEPQRSKGGTIQAMCRNQGEAVHEDSEPIPLRCQASTKPGLHTPALKLHPMQARK